MLCISRGGPEVTADSPYHAMLNGLSRVLRSEDPSRILMTLLWEGHSDSPNLASSIHKILTALKSSHSG
jgi:hypothetical protein